MFCFSITSLTASAATTFRAWPELWPSPWPGAPGTIGSCQGTPGFCEALGMQSISLPKAMVGPPVPWVQVAVHAVGMPETPRLMVKPFCSSTLVM